MAWERFSALRRIGLPAARRRSHFHLWLALFAALLLLPLLGHEQRSRQQESAQAPLFVPASGQFEHDLLVTLEGAPAGAVYYFTRDGSDPQFSGQRYETPLPVQGAAVTVIRARYQRGDGSWSDAAAATYVTNLPVSLPLLSVIAEPELLWDPASGVIANPENRGRDWEAPVELMFFEGERSHAPQQLAFVSPAGLRVHGSASRGYPKLSLRLYFRAEYGNGRLNYDLYAGQANMALQQFDRLLLHSGAQDYAYPDSRGNWTLLRASLLYELAAQVGVYTAQSRPALLFVNGVSQGIFQMRTVVDETYLHDRYGFRRPGSFHDLRRSGFAWGVCLRKAPSQPQASRAGSNCSIMSKATIYRIQPISLSWSRWSTSTISSIT